MSTRDDDLLSRDHVPEDLADLFAAERHRPSIELPGEDFEARLWSRLATLGPAGGGGGGGGGGGHGGGADAPAGGDAVGPSPEASLAPPAVVAHTGVAWLGTTAAKIAFTAAVFVAGGATSLVVEHAVLPARVTTLPAQTTASAESSVSPPPAATVVVAPIASAPPAVETEPPPSSRPVASPPSAFATSSAAKPGSSANAAADRDADLAAERALLERARTALGRGDASGAVDALGQHASRFPRGRLGEEREALWIQALVASGRTDEARARFERFRARHPQSLLVQALESTLGR